MDKRNIFVILVLKESLNYDCCRKEHAYAYEYMNNMFKTFRKLKHFPYVGMVISEFEFKQIIISIRQYFNEYCWSE